MPQLSIITVNYNNNPGLLLTLDSIKKQQFTNYEHIIIDAASTDGSLDTILEYAKGNPHLTYWVSEPDKGIYDGMNKGIDHASGEYLLFMNSGDFLDGDVLYKIPLGGGGIHLRRCKSDISIRGQRIYSISGYNRLNIHYSQGHNLPSGLLYPSFPVCRATLQNRLYSCIRLDTYCRKYRIQRLHIPAYSNMYCCT